MKPFTQFLLASVGASLLFVSCEKETVTASKENPFEVPFKTSTNEHVELRNEGSKVLLTVKNISDRRCANHLDCSDPGAAAVRIVLSNNANSKAESLLYLGTVGEERKDIDSVTVQLDKAWYVVYLHQVNPHPMSEADEVQTAELSVRPKL